jgi:AraC family transcriptional regulator
MRSDGDARINIDGEIRCDDSSDEAVTSTERALSATFSPAGAVDRRIMRASGMAAEIVHGIAHGRILTHVHGQRHTLIAYHRGLRRSRDTFIGGMSHASTNHFAHKLVFVPAGHEYRHWHEIGTDLLALVFYLDPAMVRVSAGKMPADGTLALRLFFEDAPLWATGVKMKELIDSAPDDQQYFEALGIVLIHEIVRLKSRSQECGGLAGWQQRTVAQYVDEHLSEPIALATLAGLVRLSPYYFCRAFTKSFGMPPHRYLVDCRVDRAKQLLAESDWSISDVALEVGYADISAFSCAFRKLTGLTATFYRRHVERPPALAGDNRGGPSGKSRRQVRTRGAASSLTAYSGRL